MTNLGASTQKEAKSLGCTHYFTGKPCKRGHISKRYAVDASCMECSLEKGRNPTEKQLKRRRELDNLRYAANPEKFRGRRQKRVNSGAVAGTLKEWKEANPTYFRDWYAQNIEDQRAKRRKRWAEKPEIYNASVERRRARKANAEGNFTKEDLKKIRSSQNDRCMYCRVPLLGKGHLDHIFPLSEGGSNWPVNLQYLCASCNTSKGSKDPIKFIEEKVLPWGL